MEIEAFDRITLLGLPKDDAVHSANEWPFKFRVTLEATVKGFDGELKSEFGYHGSALARRCYRNMLLGLYRSREIARFRICLNRMGDAKWENAILAEEETK